MGDVVSLEDRVGVPVDLLTRLTATVQGHRGLDDVVRWGAAQLPPVQIADVVIQDELNHDVILPVPGHDLFLVYGTT
jgi:hypothetical protein